MAYRFPNASVVGYSRESKFLGENFHYANVKNFTVEGFIRDVNSSSGVKNIFQTMSGIIFSGAESSVTDPFITYQEVFLKDVSIGSGRVTNISFNEGEPNTVRRTNYTVELEVFDSGHLTDTANTGNISNLTGIYYTGVRDAFSNSQLTSNDLYLGFVDSVDESFSFNKSEQGDYSFEHDVSITFLDQDTGRAITGARSIASGLFATDPSFGVINNEYSGYYSKLRSSGVKNFSETYDLINLSFDFTKSYNLLSENVFEHSGAKYNLNTNHDFRVNENGTVLITEQGSVKSLGGPLGQAVTGALYQVENEARSRCTSIYTGYKDSSNRHLFSFQDPYNSLDDLNTVESNLSFDVDVNSNSVTYSVSFTNDLYQDPSGSRTTSYSASLGSEGVIEINESTEYVFNFSTGIAEGVSLIRSKYEEFTTSPVTQLDSMGKNFIFERGIFNTDSPALTSQNFQISNQDNLTFSYDLVKSYSKSFAEAVSISANFKKYDIDFSDQIGQKIRSTYQIENPTNFEILQRLDNFEVSTRSVSAALVMKRAESSSSLHEDFDSEYLTKANLLLIENKIKNEIVQFAVLHNNVVCHDVFFTEVSYSFDNDLNLIYSATANIITRK